MFVHEASIPPAKLHLQPRALVFKLQSRSTILRLWSHLALGLWESQFIYLHWNFREESGNTSLSFPEEPSSVTHSGQSVLHQSCPFLPLVSIPLHSSWQYPSHPRCIRHFSLLGQDAQQKQLREKEGSSDSQFRGVQSIMGGVTAAGVWQLLTAFTLLGSRETNAGVISVSSYSAQASSLQSGLAHT